MGAEQIRQLEPKLERFLERFAEFLARKTTKRKLRELGIRLTEVPRCSWGRS
jgi:hypothetical protein